MEFLVEFGLNVPEGTPESDIRQRESAEAAASAGLAREGHLVRLWKPVAPGERKAVGLYRADSEAQLGGLLGALQLSGWMQITVTPLEPHPNDPTSAHASLFQLPDPRLTPAYRSEYTFRATTQIETAAPELDWLNKGVFVSVAGRQADRVIHETYLVG
jgi:muconolactone D-isomerase